MYIMVYLLSLFSNELFPTENVQEKGRKKGCQTSRTGKKTSWACAVRGAPCNHHEFLGSISASRRVSLSPKTSRIPIQVTW